MLDEVRVKRTLTTWLVLQCDFFLASAEQVHHNLNMTPVKSFLQKQLEHEKYLHGAAYTQNSARSLKKLTTTELAYLNQMVGGDSESSWRFEALEILIPGGRKREFSILSNPIAKARDLLGESLRLEGNGEPIRAAVYLYTQLILSHLFLEANRRTAALACFWRLCHSKLEIDPLALLVVPVGDLMEPTASENLHAKITQLIRPGGG